MKNVCLIVFLFFLTSSLSANERNIELNKLFKALKNNSNISLKVEQKIWQLWSIHPKNQKLTLMLQEGSRLVGDGKLFKATTPISASFINNTTSLT